MSVIGISPTDKNHRNLLGVLRPEACVFVAVQEVRQDQTDYEYNKRTDGEKDAKISAEMPNRNGENQTSGDSHSVQNFTESSFGHDRSVSQTF